MAIIETYYFSKFGAGGDFAVYQVAGEKFRHFVSPWDSSVDYDGLYLHGPVTALLMASFTAIPEPFGLFFLRILIIVSIPALLKTYLTILRKEQVNNQYVWAGSVFLLFTTPVRASLDYGRFEIFYFLLLGKLALTIVSENSKPKSEVLYGVIAYAILDYKFQVFFMPTFLALVHLKKIRPLIGLSSSALFGCALSVLITKNFPLSDWANVIQLRAAGVELEQGGAIFSTGYGFGISPQFSVLAGLLVLLSLMETNPKSGKFGKVRNLKAIPYTYLLFLPILHPQDLFWIPMLVVSFMISEKAKALNILIWFSLGTTVIWSNNTTINLIMMVLGILILIAIFRPLKPLDLGRIVIFSAPFILFELIILLIPRPGEGLARHLILALSVLTILIQYSASLDRSVLQ